jgi:prevent-host-death family protein
MIWLGGCDMAVKVDLDRVVPLTEARSRLSEIVDKTAGDQSWVLTRRGGPTVAMVDVDYLDQLIRRAWFEDLASRSRLAFENDLKERGMDPDSVTEEEIEEILHD